MRTRDVVLGLMLLGSVAVSGCLRDGKNVGTPDGTLDTVEDQAQTDLADLGVPDGNQDLAQDIQADAADVAPDIQPDTGTYGPVPKGAVTEYQVGTEGGSFFLPGLVSIEIPKGALDSEITLTVVEVERPTVEGYEAAGRFYQFGPAGLEFNAPVTLTFPLNMNEPPQHPLGLLGQDDEGNYFALPAVADWATSTASAKVYHFSLWGLTLVKKLCSSDIECYQQGKVSCHSVFTLERPVCTGDLRCFVLIENCGLGMPFCQDGSCIKRCDGVGDCPGGGKPICKGDTVVSYQCKQVKRPPNLPIRACVEVAGTDCGASKRECIGGQCYQNCKVNCIGKECGDAGCPGTSCGQCASWEECQAGQCVAVAQCEGKECGPDGFGFNCGECAEGKVCHQGSCCTPNCAAKECGSDGCGGTCGECTHVNPVSGYTDYCLEGQCTCVSHCTQYFPGRDPFWFHLVECGDGGCGESCGDCPGGAACVDGTCSTCIPNCTGKNCGLDGCGGTCGTCGGGQYCEMGTCIDSICGDLVCDSTKEDFCNCQYDCPLPPIVVGADLSVCGCDAQGAPIFLNNPPAGKRTCSGYGAASGYCWLCNEIETCGGANGECIVSNGCGITECGPSPTTGVFCGECASGEQCVWGMCEGPCVPSCLDKECGWDGCQGSCGTCSGEQACVFGVCQAGCSHSCDGLECGYNGCQEPCGVCPDREQCSYGQCVPSCLPECAGKECGFDGCWGTCGTCPSGMGCNENMGTCEACQPQCYEGQECGNDGCGGSCGTCPAGSECLQGFYCSEVCVPDCTNRACGSDGCSGQCGACALTATCVENQNGGSGCGTTACGLALVCLEEAQFNPDYVADCAIHAGNYVPQYNAVADCLVYNCSQNPTMDYVTCVYQTLATGQCAGARLTCVETGEIEQ